jgi:hypothetical protein
MADINMDRVTYVRPFGGYTRLHFGRDHFVDVKETPDQIINTREIPDI